MRNAILASVAALSLLAGCESTPAPPDPELQTLQEQFDELFAQVDTLEEIKVLSPAEAESYAKLLAELQAQIAAREAELAPDPGVTPEQEVAAGALGTLAGGPVGGAIAVAGAQLLGLLSTRRGRAHLARSAQNAAKLKALEALRDFLKAAGFHHSTATTEKVYEAEATGEDPVIAVKQAKAPSDAPAASKA